MKVGLLICTYNRPEYLKLCLESLKRADLSKVNAMIFVDDNSSNLETVDLIHNFSEFGLNVNPTEKFNLEKSFKDQNKSIKHSLLTGFQYLLEYGCDTFINLDGDAIVRNDFVDVLLSHHEKYPEGIVTGFNCNTLNRDGSIRHKNLWVQDGVLFRESVGGINMCFGRSAYFNFVKPALLHTLQHGGNWDHMTCINSMAASLPISVTVPSVVQHIGINSSMGHDAGGEPADVADDFKPLSLPNVTLIGVADDCAGLAKAADISTENIVFGGGIKILSVIANYEDERFIKPAGYFRYRERLENKGVMFIDCKKIGSKTAYSQFVFKEVVKYVDTDYFIIFQADGFILNWKAWTNEFFEYDYIGAPFEWYNDGMQVGNGGFSFRSKKLHQLILDEKLELCNDQYIKDFAEDHNICRIHRPFLESKGIKFAPVELARKFSIEAWKSHDNKYKGSFGFHGFSVDFSGTQLPYIPYLLPNNERKIF